MIDLSPYRSYFSTRISLDAHFNCFVTDVAQVNLAEYYASEYTSGHYKNLSSIDPSPRRLSWVFGSDFVLLSKFLDWRPRASNRRVSLLEVGANNGGFAQLCNVLGFDYHGLELDRAKFANLVTSFEGTALSRNFHNINVDEYVGSGGELFDAVYMRHVLEHVVDPVRFLSVLHPLLKNDGIVYLNVPCCESKENLIKSVRNNPHVFHFTSQALQLVIREAGYRVLSFFPASWTVRGGFYSAEEFSEMSCQSRLQPDSASGAEFLIAVIASV